MKAILSFFLLFVSFTVIAQNGGQAPEHASLKIEYGGYFGGKYLVRVTNKLCKPVQAVLSWPNHPQDSTVNLAVGANSFYLAAPFDPSGTVKARTSDKCDNKPSNSGWVEAGTYATLPVRILQVNQRKLEAGKYQVSITVINDEPNAKLWFRFTHDGGITYRKIPIEIQVSNEPKTYTAIVNLN